MTNCNQSSELFPGFLRRRVEVSFDGGDVSSDAGLLLLRQVDKKLGLLKAVAKGLVDPRHPKKCDHLLVEMLKSRVYGLCCGYEDLNDHDHLRHDLVLQTALERLTPAASSPTLCRFENRQNRASAIAIHDAMLEQFIASYSTAPEELILDFDATDDPVHGHQVGRFFHGYYDSYCFLPLYVFCGEQLLVSYLRPAKIDAAKHAAAILKLLVKRLRQAWPSVRILFRGDSGFCRRKLVYWCERNHVGYVVGLAKNERLLKLAQRGMDQASRRYQQTQAKQRQFYELRYAAKTWKQERRVILKAEYSDQGANPRFILTNLTADPQSLYDDIYCARGDMENRIKEQQLGLFADRTSAHEWWANQFRLLLSSLAYVLMETLRRVGLHSSELAHAQCWTLRNKLLKVGAVILRNTRRIRFFLPTSFPYQSLFLNVAACFNSS